MITISIKEALIIDHWLKLVDGEYGDYHSSLETVLIDKLEKFIKDSEIREAGKAIQNSLKSLEEVIKS